MTTRIALTSALALSTGMALALPRAGSAQPDPPADGAPTPTAPAPGDPAAPSPPPSPPPAAAAAATGRPSGLAFAIGVGYRFPTSLQTPNLTSARVRLPNGLTFEPQLAFATTTQDTATASTRQTELSLGAAVRHPLRGHRKVDLEVIGAAVASTRSLDPAGDGNDLRVTSVALDYGVALSYWFTPHWSLGLTATNPLFGYSRARQEAGTAVTVDTTTTIGLVFDPQVALMIHLYD